MQKGVNDERSPEGRNGAIEKNMHWFFFYLIRFSHLFSGINYFVTDKFGLTAEAGTTIAFRPTPIIDFSGALGIIVKI